RFKLADLATSRGERRAPAHLADETQVSALTRATVALYTENVLAMARLAAANGARFIVVLNPTSNRLCPSHAGSRLRERGKRPCASGRIRADAPYLAGVGGG